MATADMTRDLPTASTWELRGPPPGAYDEADGGDAASFTSADIFVATAITLASVALMLALILQAGTPVLPAFVTGGCVWIAMLISHMALRRVDGRATATWEDEDQTDDDGHQAPAYAAPAPFDSTPRWDLPATKSPAGRAPVADADREPTLDALRPAGERAAAAALTPERHQRTGRTLKPLAADDDAAWLDDVDLGDVRPKAAPELPGPLVMTAPPSSQPGHVKDENIEDMLRRLAADISRGRKTSDAAASTKAAAAHAPRAGTDPGPLPARAPAPPTRRAGHAQPPPLPPKTPLLPASPGPSLAMPPITPDNVANQIPRRPATAPMPAQARPQTAAERLAAIADALSDEQIDVFLETINGLDDYRARHYEVSVRITLADGQSLGNDELIAETRGSALLPLIEAVKVSSTKRIAIQMLRRGRSGDFFALVDGEALETGQFSEDMETIIGGDQSLAARLVLAFSQSDVRSFTTAQWDSLREIAGLGFRFSLEEITDLDMDFEKLASNGFAFTKLDAEVFLEGLPIENTRVPAADICRYLAGTGLALIVGNIRDEATRARILGLGALFGQGTLFGAPRPVRSDVLRQREATATVR